MGREEKYCYGVDLICLFACLAWLLQDFASSLAFYAPDIDKEEVVSLPNDDFILSYIWIMRPLMYIKVLLNIFSGSDLVFDFSFVDQIKMPFQF